MRIHPPVTAQQKIHPKKIQQKSLRLVVQAAQAVALAVALAVLIRTERRLRRLLGIVEGYLPRKQKNTQIRVDL